MTALTDAELAEIEIIAQRHQADRRPAEHWRLLEAIPSVIAELRSLRGEAERMRAVVEAAEAVRDQGSAWAGDDLDVAVDAYRAAKETGR